MYQLLGKRILLGVTGGIAAYKSALLLRLLRQYGADVRVVMTCAAGEFITPLTMQALSGKPVHQDLLDLDTESAMGHIELARWPDLIVVAPASANFVARYANGFADDLLSTLCLAAEVPVFLAPAMNQQMWSNAATQENIARLRERKIAMIGPAEGDQACGEVGPGRMSEPEVIALSLARAFENEALVGSRVLITAGPTREAIDPVRYISNRSSGRMGYAVAQAAIEAGADVTLVSGPIDLTVPEKAQLTRVNSAVEMHQAVMDCVTNADIFIAAAAVADYRLASVADQKMKKTKRDITLHLIKNPDILAEVAALVAAPFTVGFAAETENLEENARKKLKTKRLDMIAANAVGEDHGFDSANNTLSVFWSHGQTELALTTKEKLARQLVGLVADHFHEKNTHQTH